MRSTSSAAKRLGLLATQLLLSPGPKMIWQFGELGANQSTKNSGGNNTAPKRVIWNNLDHTHYAGLHDIYRALLHLRNDNPELFAANAIFSTSGLGGNVTNARTMTLRSGDKEVIAFINPASSGNAMTVSANAIKLSASNNQLITCTPGVTPTLNGSGTVNVSLPANSMAVFATKDVTGVEDIINDGNATLVLGGVGEIVIVGDYTSAEVYTLEGRRIDRLDSLAKGIYIVLVDGTTHKVAVK